MSQAAGALSEINSAVAESSGLVASLAETGALQTGRSAAIQGKVRSISAMASASLDMATETATLSLRLDVEAQETTRQLGRFKLPGNIGQMAA